MIIYDSVLISIDKITQEYSRILKNAREGFSTDIPLSRRRKSAHNFHYFSTGYFLHNTSKVIKSNHGVFSTENLELPMGKMLNTHWGKS